MKDLTTIHQFENQPNNLSPMFPTFPGTSNRMSITHFNKSYPLNSIIVQRHPNHKSNNRKALVPIPAMLLIPNPLHHQHPINIATEHNPVLLYVEILYFLVKIFEQTPKQYQESYASIYKFFDESFHAFLYNRRSFCKLKQFTRLGWHTFDHTTVDLWAGPNSEQGVGQWQPA